MIRRLLQALDPDLLTAAIGDWLNGRGTTTEEPATRQAIAVDGNTLRGSRSSGNTARHVLAACDQDTSVVLASTDVDGKTNEITRFKPLLDQISDLRGTVITVGALHCQRDHVTYLAERGADWILTVKGNQPTLHQQWPPCPGEPSRTPPATPTADTAAARSSWPSPPCPPCTPRPWHQAGQPHIRRPPTITYTSQKNTARHLRNEDADPHTSLHIPRQIHRGAILRRTVVVSRPEDRPVRAESAHREAHACRDCAGRR
ncbi:MULTISPECIES: ISAs1 family transposase [Streptomyces]|uniref:ISAs1 family transposase n=1 Tax=Streptomyces TaxID=1883 RepID=UPI003379FF85